jgi:curved DNA-binding protein CbpA
MGALIDQPLAELIREILTKTLSGTLRLANGPVQTAVYFDNGRLIYAATNLRTLRLREYLIKRNIIPEKEVARLDANLADLDLAANLTARGTLRQKDVDALLNLLVSDILRVGLLWTEGSWDFDRRTRLVDAVNVSVDIAALLREAADRLPITFVSQRFRNPSELISRPADLSPTSKFVPAESFILSRLDTPLRLEELLAISGLPEAAVLRVIYGLTLSGLLKREFWKNAFRTEAPKTTKEKAAPVVVSSTPAKPEQTDNWIAASVEVDELQEFLRAIRKATNHFEVLALPPTADANEIKDAYYAMARRYHPDRFHLKSGAKLAEISSAFARVTQAYETLMDPKARAIYERTVKFRQSAESTVKPDTSTQAGATGEPTNFDSDSSEAEFGSAEDMFREGRGALEQGHIDAAIKNLATAAHLEPQVARYRAYYGRALAADEKTRRLAENEIQTAVRLEPENAMFHTMLAELYFDLKFHRRAQTELDRALAIEPNNMRANLLLRKFEKSRKVG